MTAPEPSDPSGLYTRPDGTRYFLDVDCEERWIQSMVEESERLAEAYEHTAEIDKLTEELLNLPEEDPDPRPRRMRVRGLMFGLEDHHA